MYFQQGIDIVEINRISKVYQRFGFNFLIKVLSREELKIIPIPKKKRLNFISGRFVVKEALVKALGTGFTGKFTWGNIGYFSPTKRYGVAHPQVRLNDTLMNDNLLEGMKIHLSVSDESKYVTAYVILERQWYGKRNRFRKL